MKLYVGIYLHATNTYVRVVGEEYKVAHKQRFRNDLPLILAGLDLPSHLFAYSTKLHPLCLERVKNG